MAAVTVTRRKTDVVGSKKHKEFTVTIAASGDTLDTRLRRIDEVIIINPNDSEITGEATMVGGTVTVAETRVAATDRLQVSRKTAGGVLGNLTISAVAATSITVASDNAGDTSTATYRIIKPRVTKTTTSGGVITFTTDGGVSLAGVKLLVIGV